MEWLVALLVAAIESQGRNRAEYLYKRPGEAMRALKDAAQSDDELLRLYEDSEALRKRRHLLAHSVAMVAMDARDNKVYLYWNPRSDEEARALCGRTPRDCSGD
jgi:hypothetical protein